MRDSTTTLAELRRRIASFVAERDWEQFHDGKNLSMAIAIEAAELMEHFQWVHSDRIAETLLDAKKTSEVRDELADITCFVLALANALDIDLANAVEQKIEKNALKYPVETSRGTYVKPG